MIYLPLFHNLEDRECLVVGAGTTATRKLRWLVRTGARIHVVAPEVSADVEALATLHKIALTRTVIDQSHLRARLALVVSATGNTEVNKNVYAWAIDLNVPVNCVDDAARCTVQFPAIIDRAPVLVAVGSMGKAPTLTRMVRGWIEERLPSHLGALAELSSDFRDRVKQALPEVTQRMRFWEGVLSGPVADQVRRGDMDAARAELGTALSDAGSADHDVRAPGLTLIGAGPGDPELITLKGLRCLQRADVVLYDQLANPHLLDYARRDAELIYVGKQGPKPGQLPNRPDNRSSQQSDINALILEHLSAGESVVRLKGGDPFIYGRGGEEMEAAIAAGYSVQVIPGITASLGAASYAGIPLTHRNLSHSVRFVTGHRAENLASGDGAELARNGETLVIYMGLVGLAGIMQALMDDGCEAQRPVALVENATLPEQRVLRTTVAEAAADAENASISGPTVVIVGEVVGLATLSPTVL